MELKRAISKFSEAAPRTRSIRWSFFAELAPDQQLFLIVGADAAANLHTWQRYEELPELATLVIVDREGDHTVEPLVDWDIVRVAIPRLDISSSDLRDRVRNGRPLEPLVVPSVINEIQARGLYGLADS